MTGRDRKEKGETRRKRRRDIGGRIRERQRESRRNRKRRKGRESILPIFPPVER